MRYLVLSFLAIDFNIATVNCGWNQKWLGRKLSVTKTLQSGHSLKVSNFFIHRSDSTKLNFFYFQRNARLTIIYWSSLCSVSTTSHNSRRFRCHILVFPWPYHFRRELANYLLISSKTSFVNHSGCLMVNHISEKPRTYYQRASTKILYNNKTRSRKRNIDCSHVSSWLEK